MKTNFLDSTNLKTNDIFDVIERLEQKLKRERSNYFDMCARHENKSVLFDQEQLISKIEEKLNEAKGQLTEERTISMNL